jgi:hypothetical protein
LKSGTEQNAKSDLVGDYIEAILRGAMARKTTMSTRLNYLTNLAGALT